MKMEGVRTVSDQSKLAVVGLAEVVTHLPAIWAEYRKLVESARIERPAAAILTDSSGFHLRVAAALHNLGVPVVYLVAPQAWAWRRGRVKKLRRNVDRLLCIFPFEEKFFRSYGVPAHYIGHPLARLIRPQLDREGFFRLIGFRSDRPLVALLPGSRSGEISRHLPILCDTVALLRARFPDAQFALAAPPGIHTGFISDSLAGLPVQVLSGHSWDLLAHCDLALAASGTVTVEAALLGAPMVTFYRVSALTWWIGRPLVRVPFFSMVNLVAGRRIVAELIQSEATGEWIAAEASLLLEDPIRRQAMKDDLRNVSAALASEGDPIDRAADHVLELIGKKVYANR